MKGGVLARGGEKYLRWGGGLPLMNILGGGDGDLGRLMSKSFLSTLPEPLKGRGIRNIFTRFG